MVATPRRGACFLSDDLTPDEIPATGGRRWFALRGAQPLRRRAVVIAPASPLAMGFFSAASIGATPRCGARLFRLISAPTKFPPPAVVGASSAGGGGSLCGSGVRLCAPLCVRSGPGGDSGVRRCSGLWCWSQEKKKWGGGFSSARAAYLPRTL